LPECNYFSVGLFFFFSVRLPNGRVNCSFFCIEFFFFPPSLFSSPLGGEIDGFTRERHTPRGCLLLPKLDALRDSPKYRDCKAGSPPLLNSHLYLHCGRTTSIFTTVNAKTASLSLPSTVRSLVLPYLIGQEPTGVHQVFYRSLPHLLFNNRA